MPHCAPPITCARMPSGLTAVPTSVATVSFFTFTVAVVGDRDMGDASRPGRGLALLRADAGDAEAFALRQLLGAIAGEAHRRAQRVGEALRARVVAGAVEHREPEFGRDRWPAACAISSIMLSTAQNVQPGATERNCPDGVAFCASSLRTVRIVWLGTV